MKVYVNKSNTRNFIWYPVPSDLENWYETETELEIGQLADMDFDPETQTFFKAPSIFEGQARAKRDSLLRRADILVSIAFDNDDTERLEALKAYRIALRDVPEQEGFPLSINWPTIN